MQLKCQGERCCLKDILDISATVSAKWQSVASKTTCRILKLKLQKLRPVRRIVISNKLKINIKL